MLGGGQPPDKWSGLIHSYRCAPASCRWPERVAGPPDERAAGYGPAEPDGAGLAGLAGWLGKGVGELIGGWVGMGWLPRG